MILIQRKIGYEENIAKYDKILRDILEDGV
jgi:hypothetical protein